MCNNNLIHNHIRRISDLINKRCKYTVINNGITLQGPITLSGECAAAVQKNNMIDILYCGSTLLTIDPIKDPIIVSDNKYYVTQKNCECRLDAISN